MTIAKLALAASVGTAMLVGSLASAEATTHRSHMSVHHHRGFKSTTRSSRTTPAAIGQQGAGENGPAAGSIGK